MGKDFRKIKVGVFQFAPVFGEIKKNVDYVTKRLSGVEVDLVVLPELCTTGYQFVSREEVLGLSEEVSASYAVAQFMKVARSQNMCIVFGMAELGGDNVLILLFTLLRKVLPASIERCTFFSRNIFSCPSGERAYKREEANLPPFSEHTQTLAAFDCVDLRRGECPVEYFADEVLGGFHVTVPHHLAQCGVSPDEYLEDPRVIFRQCPRFESFEKSFQFPLDFFCHGSTLHEYTIAAAKAALS